MGNEGRGEIKRTALPYGDITGKVIRLAPSFLCKDNRERARQRERGEIGTKNGVWAFGYL